VRGGEKMTKYPVKLRKSKATHNVLCESNDAIVCYCDTEFEANEFIDKYNSFIDIYIKKIA